MALAMRGISAKSTPVSIRSISTPPLTPLSYHSGGLFYNRPALAIPGKKCYHVQVDTKNAAIKRVIRLCPGQRGWAAGCKPSQRHADEVHLGAAPLNGTSPNRRRRERPPLPGRRVPALFRRERRETGVVPRNASNSPFVPCWGRQAFFFFQRQK